MSTIDSVWWITLIGFIITQIVLIIQIAYNNHSKKKWIKEQISCKKRETWDIQKQLTSIVCSGDILLMQSDYVKQLVEKLKQLKKEIAELNAQLKPKDQDKTKLNITESINMLNETIKKIGGK